MISCEVSRVEIAGRLVGEQQARRVDQRARDGDALLLAAGELARRVALAIAEADEFQRSARPLAARRAADRPRCRVKEGKLDILDGARPGEEIEALEDEAKALAADARRVPARSSPATSTPSRK